MVTYCLNTEDGFRLGNQNVTLSSITFLVMGDDEDRLTDVVRKFGESPDSYDGMVTTMEKPNNDQSTKVGVVTSRTCLDI